MQSASNATPYVLLSNDLAQCHALIIQLMAVKDELTATLRLQEREKAHLLHRVEYLVRQLYGRRSEKIDPAQLLLFVAQAMEAVAAEPAAEVEPEEAPATRSKKKGHGRKKPPVELPHLPIEHPVADADKVCVECGTEKKRIGEKITEQLEYAPASLFVIDHIQPVFACPCCEGHVTVAPKPAQPIEKGLPGPGLLAQVVVSKYGDHLPLYRQESIFQRHGVAISRKTMCDWVRASAHMLEPVVEAMKARILESKVIHTDDTPVTVREPGQSGTHQGRFWVYLGDGDHPYTVYDYTPSRKRDGPIEFLCDFKGTKENPRYLQADAYGGYDGIYTGEETGTDPSGAVVIECACWAHCRRYFYNARGSDPVRSHQVLGWVRQLYDIEHDAKESTADDRWALRQEKAKPILDDIKEWLDAQQGRILPKSPIGEAVQYAFNQWKALLRYIEDGDIAIDNNAAERRIRGIAIGRRNWLFAGSDRGGRTAAILYSVIQSAKDHAIEPFAYLRDLFLRIPTYPNKDIHQLLPDNWKRDILPNLDTPPRL
jgi:transposase